MILERSKLSHQLGSVICLVYLGLDGIDLNSLIFSLSPYELTILLSSRPLTTGLGNDVIKLQKERTLKQTEMGQE